jgi:hypothetical protein
MRVHVKIHPYLRQCVFDAEKLVPGAEWDVPEGTTAARIAAILNLPRGFPVIVMVNDSFCHDPTRALLKEADRVMLSPVMASG